LIFWKNIARALMRVSLAGFIQCYMFDSREKIQKNYNKNGIWSDYVSSFSYAIIYYYRDIY